jgi:hypothetical protein
MKCRRCFPWNIAALHIDVSYCAKQLIVVGVTSGTNGGTPTIKERQLRSVQTLLTNRDAQNVINCSKIKGKTI